MVQFPARARDFSHLQSIQTGPESTLLCIQWVPRALSMGTKQPVWEADQSPPTYDMFQVGNSILTYLLTPWSRALLEKLTGSQHFIESEGSLPHSRVSATCPHSQPDQSSPCPHFLRCILISSSHLKPGSSKWSLSVRFPHHNPAYASPFPPYVLHAPPISFFPIWSPEQYRVSSTDH
jgi:hypothetical protein